MHVQAFRSCTVLMLLMSNPFSIKAQSKYLYFDFLQDSIKAKTVKLSAPAGLQAFSLNNSLVTDYLGNTRICMSTGIISGKKDTVIALQSLVTGSGNFSLESETPILVKKTRKRNKRDFIGTSINPRISAVISNYNTFETSMISYDFGWNMTGQFSGDLGNIIVKYTLRNAICVGNNRFVQKAFEFQSTEFIYTSVQLKIRAGANIFSLNHPIYIYSVEGKLVKNLPVFVGYALLF